MRSRVSADCSRPPEIATERESAHDYVLIEAFIPGREHAIEGALTEGTLQVFAIFDKPDPLDGPFFEETIYVTPSRAPRATQHAIVEAVAGAARALGLHHGPIHAECRVNTQESIFTRGGCSSHRRPVLEGHSICLTG